MKLKGRDNQLSNHLSTLLIFWHWVPKFILFFSVMDFGRFLHFLKILYLHKNYILINNSCKYLFSFFQHWFLYFLFFYNRLRVTVFLIVHSFCLYVVYFCCYHSFTNEICFRKRKLLLISEFPLKNYQKYVDKIYFKYLSWTFLVWIITQTFYTYTYSLFNLIKQNSLIIKRLLIELSLINRIKESKYRCFSQYWRYYMTFRNVPNKDNSF